MSLKEKRMINRKKHVKQYDGKRQTRIKNWKRQRKKRRIKNWKRKRMKRRIKNWKRKRRIIKKLN